MKFFIYCMLPRQMNRLKPREYQTQDVIAKMFPLFTASEQLGYMLKIILWNNSTLHTLLCLQKIIRMRKRENVQKHMYELLKWVEEHQQEHIVLFWKCAFNDTIINQYPKLQMLHRSLMDGQSPLSCLYLFLSMLYYVYFCVAESSRCT